MATFIVEDGTGIAGANSYVTVAAADAYDADHGALAAWSAASESEKQEALRLATQYLDMNYNGRWRGQKADGDQGLAWPRISAVDDDGYTLEDVPDKLAEACVEMALASIAGDDFLPSITDPGQLSEEKIKVGPIETTEKWKFGKGEQKQYTKVDALLLGLLQSSNRLILGM